MFHIHLCCLDMHELLLAPLSIKTRLAAPRLGCLQMVSKREKRERRREQEEGWWEGCKTQRWWWRNKEDLNHNTDASKRLVAKKKKKKTAQKCDAQNVKAVICGPEQIVTKREKKKKELSGYKCELLNNRETTLISYLSVMQLNQRRSHSW